MNKSTTRREFLRTTAAGIAAGAALEHSASLGASSTGAPTTPAAPAGTVAVRVTDASRKFAEAPGPEWRAAESVPAADAITLDPGKTFQEHLGIGAAFTDSACYTFSQLAGPAREQLFHEMFHPSEMGLSVGRICIGSSDYSREMYSYDEGAPDPELTRFSVGHDRAYILPVLGQARRVNPDLLLLASPWSPPGWMKPNGSMLGGCMHRKTMAPYARYFLKFLQAYEAEGVRVNFVSSQNEVDTEQDGNMPACAWPQEYEISFISDHLGPLLRKAGLDTQIWLLDHNYNLWGRAVCSLNDQGLRQYCKAVAWHGYVGTPDMVSKVHEAHPEADMFWTEGGPDIVAKDYATDWCNWGQTFTGAFRNWCRCAIGWNLALDEKGNPNIGPFTCGGLVTIHSQTKDITRSGQFWAMNHFSRSVQRGARRFDSQGGPGGLQHVGFESAGGHFALVLTNPGAQQNVQVRLAGQVAEVSLPPDSLVTLLWQ